MPINVKLNRRSVGTQSDLQVGVSDGSGGRRKIPGRNQFEITGKFSGLCKKSAYRNLLQRSITVDAHGKVNFAMDFIKIGRSRGTQTILTSEEEFFEEDSIRIGGEESLESAIPIPVRSEEISQVSSFLSESSLPANFEFRSFKIRREEKPGTSKFLRCDPPFLQVEDENFSVDEGSLAVIHSCDDRESIQSRISLMLHTFENQVCH